LGGNGSGDFVFLSELVSLSQLALTPVADDVLTPWYNWIMKKFKTGQNLLALLLVLLALLISVYLVSQNQDNREQARMRGELGSIINAGQYGGLSAVNTFMDEERTGDLFNKQTYNNPLISNMTFRTSWADLEPRKGVFQWNKLDRVFREAERNGKGIRLILIPGFGTPKWALDGVQSEYFTVKYGRGKDQQLNLPVPWDKTYLERWLAFLKAVAQRYGNRPTFKMIALAGPTSVSSEMSLPNTPEDIVKWQNLGYTSEKYIESWKTVINAYAEIFPSQYFSLAFYPGLPIPDRSQRDRVRREVATYAAQTYPAQSAIQTSGLNPLKEEDEGAGYQLVKEFGQQYHLLTGFMMSSAFTEKENKYGPARVALAESIDRGLAAGIKYLEIYEADVLNPSLQDELQRAATALKFVSP